MLTLSMTCSILFRIVHVRRNKKKQQTFIPEIYGTVTPDPNVSSVNDVLHITLKSSLNVDMCTAELGDLLIEVERDKWTAR